MSAATADAGDLIMMRDFAVRWTQAQPVVAAYIWSLVPNAHDAEDLLQRTAASLVSHYGDYDAARPLVSWAIGVARIEVLRFRQEQRRDRLVFDDATIDAITTAFDEGAVEFAEMRVVLRTCVERLTGRTKDVVRLHYLGELSPEAVARKLGMSVNAVFVSMHRARAALRVCMERSLSGGRPSEQ